MPNLPHYKRVEDLRDHTEIAQELLKEARDKRNYYYAEELFHVLLENANGQNPSTQDKRAIQQAITALIRYAPSVGMACHYFSFVSTVEGRPFASVAFELSVLTSLMLACSCPQKMNDETMFAVMTIVIFVLEHDLLHIELAF